MPATWALQRTVMIFLPYSSCALICLRCSLGHCTALPSAGQHRQGGCVATKRWPRATCGLDRSSPGRVFTMSCSQIKQNTAMAPKSGQNAVKWAVFCCGACSDLNFIICPGLCREACKPKGAKHTHFNSEPNECCTQAGSLGGGAPSSSDCDDGGSQCVAGVQLLYSLNCEIHRYKTGSLEALR